MEYRRFKTIMKRSDMPQVWSTSDIKDLVSAKKTFKSEDKRSDRKNLLSDLEGEHKAINDYVAHIEETNNPVIADKLQEIRDEEEHHTVELKELLDKEV
jgi:rubrerythrin